MSNLRVKLILDLVNRLGGPAKTARKDLKGVKQEADALKSASGPDKLNQSLATTSANARKAAADLAKAKKEAKSLAATGGAARAVGAAGGARGMAPLKEMAKPKERLTGLKSAALGAGGNMLGAVGIGGMVGAGGAALLAAKGLGQSLALERAMYDVARATDVSGQELANYQKQIVELALATGQAAPEIAGMLSAAGFAGRPKKELMDFTKYAAMVTTAWGVSAGEAGQALAEIGNIYQANQKRIELIGDAINTAADASAAKETDLMEVLRRAGASGRQIGVTAEQTLALGAALKEVGTQPQVIGTALQALYTNLALGDDATSDFADGLKSIKMTSKQLQAGVRKDAMGAIVQMLDKIEKIPDGLKRMEVLKKLFGREYADNIGALLNNLSGLKRLLDLMNNPKNYQGSVSRDIQKKLQTDFNKLERAQQSLDELARRLGDPLKVAAGSVAEGINSLLAAYDRLQEAKAKVDEAAKRLAEGKATAEDVQTLANDPNAAPKIAKATQQKNLDDLRANADKAMDGIDQLPPDVQARRVEDLERTNLNARIDSLQQEITTLAAGGKSAVQKKYQLGLLQNRLKNLPPGEAPAAQGKTPADQQDHIAAGSAVRADAEATAAALKLQAEQLEKLKKLRDMTPAETPGRRVVDDTISDFIRDEGRRAEKLKDTFKIDLGPTAKEAMNSFSSGIKAGQGQVEGSVQSVGDAAKGKLSGIDGSAAGQQFMASYAQGITAGGSQVVAAVAAVAAKAKAALNSGGAGGATTKSASLRGAKDRSLSDGGNFA